MRSEEEVAKSVATHYSIHYRVHSGLCSTANMADDALITLCGFDHASFELLHQLFKPCFYSFTPCRKNTDFIVRNSTTKKGRQRYLCSISCLALGLAWTRTRGSYMILQIIFGLTHGSLSVWLRFSKRIL